MLEKDIKKVLVSHDEIVEAAKKLGETLTKEYQGKNPIFVGILKGSVPFMAELINHVDTHIELDFMLVSSYHGGTASSGIINIIKDIDQDITGRDILFVEDIIDIVFSVIHLVSSILSTLLLLIHQHMVSYDNFHHSLNHIRQQTHLES